MSKLYLFWGIGVCAWLAVAGYSGWSPFTAGKWTAQGRTGSAFNHK